MLLMTLENQCGVSAVEVVFSCRIHYTYAAVSNMDKEELRMSAAESSVKKLSIR